MEASEPVKEHSGLREGSKRHSFLARNSFFTKFSFLNIFVWNMEICWGLVWLVWWWVICKRDWCGDQSNGICCHVNVGCEEDDDGGDYDDSGELIVHLCIDHCHWLSLLIISALYQQRDRYSNVLEFGDNGIMMMMVTSRHRKFCRSIKRLRETETSFEFKGT